jgi:hypothetical protein
MEHIHISVIGYSLRMSALRESVDWPCWHNPLTITVTVPNDLSFPFMGFVKEMVYEATLQSRVNLLHLITNAAVCKKEHS